jgi:hypothetical protein
LPLRRPEIAEAITKAIAKRNCRGAYMANVPSVSINKRADDQFRKLTRTEDGRKGPTEYEVRADAISAKIARLKELRLARDAAVAAVAPPPVKKAGKA